MSAFRKTERRARKPHRCCFCARSIAAGDRYIDGFSLLEGLANPWKAHTACQDIADSSPFADDDEGVPPFAAWGDENIAALSPDARAAFERAIGPPLHVVPTCPPTTT